MTEHENTANHAITTGGGWCAPSSILFRADDGSLQYRGTEGWITAEEANARNRQRLHDTRWKRRRNRLKGWLKLRPLRWKIHEYVHRNCGDDW